MSAPGAIASRAARARTLAQAARLVEAAARRLGRGAATGRDAHPGEEAVRFVASDRLSLPVGEVAGAEAAGEQVRITATVLGLAGATPALPPAYSEFQLHRRRLRDLSFARFLNLFDHRALSFFHRIAAKYRWPLQAERGEEEPIGRVALALGGLDARGVRDRLAAPDAALIPLAAHLADARRSAASVETVLRALIPLPLRVVEAHPVWMDVPSAEQTRLGGALGRFARLGDGPGGESDQAMLGAAALDAQHHFVVEIGPVSYHELQALCAGADLLRRLGDLCALAAGIEQRPLARALVPVEEVPELRLGDDAAPALLGRTSWLGPPRDRGAVADDCLIPIAAGC